MMKRLEAPFKEMYGGTDVISISGTLSMSELLFLEYGLHNIWVMLKCLTAVLEFYYFIKEFKKEK